MMEKPIPVNLTRVAGQLLALALVVSAIGIAPGFGQTAAVAAPIVSAQTTKTAITTQPKNQRVERGTKARIAVKARGAKLTYQWYFKKGSASWKKVSGAKAKKATLVITATKGINKYKYRVVVRGKNGKKTSKAMTLTTVARHTKITAHPKNISATEGTVAKFTVKASSKSKLRYQWYVIKPSSSKATKLTSASAKTRTLRVKASSALNGAKYYAVVTTKTAQLKTKTRKLSVKIPKTTITTHPVAYKTLNLVGSSNTKVTLNVKASGSSLTYQWYRKTSGENSFKALSGATKSSYTVAAATGLNKAQYRVRVIGKNGTKTSRVTQITLVQPTDSPAQEASTQLGQNDITMQGIDLSKWQHTMSQSNMNNAAKWGDFALFRVGGSHVPIGKSVSNCGKTEKVTKLHNVDCAYSTLTTRAKNAGLKIGHYWFNGWVSGTNAQGNTPEKDAAFFVANLKNYSEGDPLVLDVEASSWSLPAWNPAQSLRFLNEVDRLVQQKYGHKANLYVYISASLTRKTNYGASKGSNWNSVAAISRLWVASWGTNNGNVPSSRPVIGAWSAWSIWQYTSNATIAGSGITRLDANVARGDAWKALP